MIIALDLPIANKIPVSWVLPPIQNSRAIITRIIDTTNMPPCREVIN